MVVYLVTNSINGKQYVGQTIREPIKRWKAHLCDSKNGSNTNLHNAIRKYGKDCFIVETLHTCLSKMELDFVETFYIVFLKTMRPFGYNLTLGGDGIHGYKYTKEARIEMCLRQKANPTLGMLGKKHSTETKEILSLKRKGVPNPSAVELCRRLGKSRKGTKRSPFSDEWLKNLSLSHLGQKRTPEQCQTIRAAVKKGWINRRLRAREKRKA